MGMGQALFENLDIKQGRVQNPSFLDYKLPSTLDMAQEVQSTWVETIDPHSPFGAKGITEAILVPMPAAIANAIYDAVGVRMNSTCITPEQVLNALGVVK
jgi:CO/xanthine dehydrogenase Mo-binding subunit